MTAELPSLREEERLRKTRRIYDPASAEVLEWAHGLGIQTILDRQDLYDENFLGIFPKTGRCDFGVMEICCRQCMMGPCRLWHPNLSLAMKINAPNLRVGTCGATADTIVARNLLMRIARGTAAHAGVGRDAANVLLKTAQGRTPYEIKNRPKLEGIAGRLGLDTAKPVEALAEEVALVALEDLIGRPENGEPYMRFAMGYLPAKVKEKLIELKIMPKSAGEDLMDADHMTVVGMSADPMGYLTQGLKLGVADIVAILISTEIHDTLFGHPTPKVTRSGIGVLDRKKVNLVVHGHVPLLSEKVVQWANTAEMMDKAKAVGAEGINIVGVCCTGEEVLQRHGIPLAGNNIQEELVIATGVVDGFVVDVQCIYPNIENVADKFHTKIISTMKEAMLMRAQHIPFEEERADEVARLILEETINNFPNRTGQTFLPSIPAQDFVAGFSVEACLGVLSQVNAEDPLQPVIDNIVAGNIYGVVLIAGCTSPKVTADGSHPILAEELLKRNVLMLGTGCALGSCSRVGQVNFEATDRLAGPKLKEVLYALGEAAGLGGPLPPIWQFGP